MKLKILIVEDDHRHINAAKASLIPLQNRVNDRHTKRAEIADTLFEFHIFQTGGEAIRAIKGSLKPDLAIIDILLNRVLDQQYCESHQLYYNEEKKDTRGFDVADALAELSKETKIIFFTQYGTQPSIFSEFQKRRLGFGLDFVFKHIEKREADPYTSPTLNHILTSVTSGILQTIASEFIKKLPDSEKQQHIANIESLSIIDLAKYEINDFPVQNLMAGWITFTDNIGIDLGLVAIKPALLELLKVSKMENQVPNNQKFIGIWKNDTIQNALKDFLQHSQYQYDLQEIEDNAVRFISKFIDGQEDIDHNLNPNLEKYATKNISIHDDDYFFERFKSALTVRKIVYALLKLREVTEDVNSESYAPNIISEIAKHFGINVTDSENPTGSVKKWLNSLGISGSCIEEAQIVVFPSAIPEENDWLRAVIPLIIEREELTRS